MSKNDWLKIGDLGIARKLERPSYFKQSLISIGRLFPNLSLQAFLNKDLKHITGYAGTVKYLSPEIKEKKSYSFKTDIW